MQPMPDGQHFNSHLPPPSQLDYNNLPHMSQSQDFNRSYVSQPQDFNRSYVSQPQDFNQSHQSQLQDFNQPPSHCQRIANHSEPPTIQQQYFDNSPAVPTPNPVTPYFINKSSHPFFHPPILGPDHNRQSSYVPNSNPVHDVQHVPSLPRPDCSRIEHFEQDRPSRIGHVEQNRTSRIEHFEQDRPSRSTSQDLPELDYSITDDFDSTVFGLRPLAASISRNTTTNAPNPSVTVIAPTQTQKSSSRKSKNSTRNGELNVARQPPTKRSKKNKDPIEGTLLESTPINQSAFVNGFLPKSMLVTEDKLPTEIRSVEELMEFSDIELNILAKKYSKKRGASAEDEVFLLELHDKLEKIITINCIVRQISRDMADGILGKSSPYRGINGFQVFQGCAEARAMVKANGGIRAPGSNAMVGDAWKALGVSGQEYYNEQAAASVRKKQLHKSNKSNPTTATSNSTDSVSNASLAAPDHSNSSLSTPNPSDPAVSTHDAEESSLPQTAIQSTHDSETQAHVDSTLTCRPAKKRPLTKNIPTVQEWLNDLLPTANNIAQTYKVQIAIFCVSTFLGNGCLQLVEATPRLRSWLEMEKLNNPENHTAAQMQSAVTGCNVDELAEMSSVSEPSEVSKARTRLNQLITRETQGKFTKWPWTTRTRLEKAGYEIKLLPGASTSLEILFQPSNKLLPAQAIDINQSVLEGEIQVVKKILIKTDTAGAMASQVAAFTPLVKDTAGAMASQVAAFTPLVNVE